MLRIEKDCDGRVPRLRLSGRIESEFIPSIRSAMGDGCARKVLDLSEVTLVARRGDSFSDGLRGPGC